MSKFLDGAISGILIISNTEWGQHFPLCLSLHRPIRFLSCHLKALAMKKTSLGVQSAPETFAPARLKIKKPWKNCV